MNEKNKSIDWDKLLESLQQAQQEEKNLTTAELELLDKLKAIKSESFDLLSGYKDYHRQQRWLELKAHIADAEKHADENTHTARPRRLWIRIAAAASIILVSGIGFYFYQGSKTLTIDQVQQLASDVAPGKQGATLTLANGKKIRLTEAANGKLASQSGVTITKSANGQLIYQIENSNANENQVNTLSTTSGETYQVRLPDGSDVWLNSASSLTYKASLNEQGKRIVNLTGEAYFQVAKDKAHPFIVKTNKQEIEVLGTHFNVNSYNDEPAVATTLVEGSVKVTSGNSKQTIKPGEQAKSNGGDIKVNEVDIENVTDWKEGDFYLNHVNFKTAMRKIARWYNVEIIYDASVPADIESGGWISRNNKLSAVLESIETSGLVHFKVEGNKIYVSK
ncbi:FecR family protein [Mucilaginibacter pineti]|nr:FecR family protein [Mucilaginibacter pineti]